MSFRFNPERAIDLSVSNPNGVFALVGHYGPFPSRPCDECGSEEFHPVDWSLGYKCENNHTFGSPDEWAWDKGQYRA